MALAPQLIAAYETAEYAVGSVVLQIGKANGALDALLAARGASSAAFVTAANPRSERLSEADNAARLAALEEAVRKLGHSYLRGEGRDATGQWGAEASFLVLGISKQDARSLGRAFGQNALVFVERGHAPQLVLLA